MERLDKVFIIFVVCMLIFDLLMMFITTIGGNMTYGITIIFIIDVLMLVLFIGVQGGFFD